MDRRKFLSFLGLAPVAAVAAHPGGTGGESISVQTTVVGVNASQMAAIERDIAALRKSIPFMVDQRNDMRARQRAIRQAAA